MLERLECSVVNLLYVISEPFRLDAEYYSKKNLLIEKLVNEKSGNTISEYDGKIDCSAFYPSITGYYTNDHSLIPFLRVNEISNGLVVLTDNTVFLPQKVLDDNPSTISVAYPGDLIIAKGGNTLAKVGLVTEEYPAYATCRDVIILRTNDIKGINKYYLWSFLHSKYGQDLMWRAATQTGQPHLTLPIIMNMHVPYYSTAIQNEVEKLYVDSVRMKNESEKLRIKADKILADGLKLKKCTINTNSISIRNAKEVFDVNRIDAEYFNPKYDEYFEMLKEYNASYIPDEFEVIKNTGAAYAEGISEVGVIKTKQLTNNGVNIYNVESYFDIETCNRQKSNYLKKDDVVFATMGVGSLGKIGMFSYSGDRRFVTDSTLRIYRKKASSKIYPEFLCVFLQSDLGQELIYRYVVGSTGIINVYDDDIARIPIPVLADSIQSEIASCVKESYKLRDDSKKLLENAKRVVEIAIEQGEEAALKLLE